MDGATDMEMLNISGHRMLREIEFRAARRKRNPDPRVSPSDRALIDQAVLAGLITICPPVFCAPTRQAALR